MSIVRFGVACLLTSVTGRHSLYPSYALLVHSEVLPTDMFLHGATNTVNTTMAAARLAMVKITYSTCTKSGTCPCNFFSSIF